MPLSYEYQFPAIKGIQSGREYYVAMFPVRLIPKIFSFDDEEIPAEMRAQRQLNRSRIPEIAQYILDNPTSYVFSALTASINGEVAFKSSQMDDIGVLTIPMDARFVINDGQHRRAAFEMALRENPELGDETISVVLFVDLGLTRSQQMFSDLNRYASRPDQSLNVLYDHRDRKAILARAVVKNVSVFEKLTDPERSTLPPRSSKLFTLSSIHTATNLLMVSQKEAELETQIAVAQQYWSLISQQIPDWEQVLKKQVTAGEMRKDYVHSHAVTLAGLGGSGAELITHHPKDWTKRLKKLRSINWERSNPHWEGRVVVNGSVHNNRSSRAFMIAYLKRTMDVSLSAEEQMLLENC
jgi:DNA sulfur modification protein DndB